MPPVPSTQTTTYKMTSQMKKNKTEKLASLFKASSLIHSKRANVSELQGLACEIARAMGVDACVLGRIQDQRGDLKSMSFWGFESSRVVTKLLNDQQNLFSWTLRYQQTFVRGNQKRDKDLEKYLPPMFGEMKLKSCLVTPLNIFNEQVGVLGLFSRKSKFFTKSDVQLIKLFSTQVAMIVKNFEMVSEIKRDFLQIVKAFATIIDFNDTYTHGHSERVMNYASMVCSHFPVKEGDLETILYGSFLHDVGKIGIQTSILRKPNELNQVEWEQMVTHSQIGADIVSQIEPLRPLAPVILNHHAWYGGGGYPDPELKGEAIPLGARILSVADAYEAMTSDRTYRRALSQEKAVQQLRRFSKIQFDPNVVEAFVSALD
jgi:HD-GYP domain-containing protein (c-di-GMP phosphodiesterase class II)